MKFLKKYWMYILGFFLFLIPLLFGIFGGTLFLNIFYSIYDFITKLYYHNVLISSIVAYVIMLIMMIVLYYKNKRNVGLIRYIIAFTVINIFMILVYDLAFILVIALSRFTIYFNVFDFCRNIDFLTAHNFGYIYTFEVGITLLVVLGVKFFKKMNSVEKEVNVDLLENRDKNKMKKSGLPYFGKLDEYYNDLINGMKDDFSKKIDHPTLEELNVYFPEVRVNLKDKQKYLNEVQEKLEESINTKLKENGIEALESKNSLYDDYETNDGELSTLVPSNKLASDLKYTLYQNMRSKMNSIILNNNLYLDGLSEEKNPLTLNNRLDEVIIARSILNHYGISVEEKYEEPLTYYNVIVKQLNNLFMKLENDKNSFLNGNKVSEDYTNFDKDSLIARNINIIDELVIDSRTMVFSPKGIYSIEYLSFNNIKSIRIDESGKWYTTDYNGKVNELRDITINTKNHIAMERTHLTKQLLATGEKLKKEITFTPLLIITNEEIEIENNSDLAVMKDYEFVSYIESQKKTVDKDDLEVVKNIFIGEKEINHEYNQVDYVKYFEYIIDTYFRYMDELQTISSRLDYIIKVLTDEKVISDEYNETVKDYKTKYYSYDYMMYLAHQKHYKDDKKEFDENGHKLD